MLEMSFGWICMCSVYTWLLFAHTRAQPVRNNTRSAPVFRPGIVVGIVKSHHITEASGLAASRKHPGFLYTHNDHGGDPGIFVISATGDRVATLDLKGIKEYDLEDIALGKCSDAAISDFCIYIGDFGDGNGHPVNNIYRIPEPDVLENQDIHVDATNILEFSWDQPDCETLLVDPAANLYIVSKVTDGHGIIARLPNDAWGTHTRVDVSSTALINIVSHHRDPVAGDISPDGDEVLIKTHDSVYYWSADGTRDYVALLQTPGTKVPYTLEHQGEAVCWDATGRGYYTLGEGSNEPLYHYIRE